MEHTYTVCTICVSTSLHLFNPTFCNFNRQTIHFLEILQSPDDYTWWAYNCILYSLIKVVPNFPIPEGFCLALPTGLLSKVGRSTLMQSY